MSLLPWNFIWSPLDRFKFGLSKIISFVVLFWRDIVVLNWDLLIDSIVAVLVGEVWVRRARVRIPIRVRRSVRWASFM